MSAVFNVNGDGLTQANNVAPATDYTAMCWARITSSFAAVDYQTVFSRQNAAATQYAGLFVYNDGTGLLFEVDVRNEVPATISLVSGTYLTLNQWYHLAYTKSGTTHNFYIDGVLVDSGTLSLAAATFDDLKAGFDGFLGVAGLDIVYFREFNDNLSLTQITSEINSQSPVDVAEIVTDTPLINDILDDSGNGNDWTETGSVSFSADTPYPFANIGSTTATDVGDLAVPFEGTIDLNPSGNYAFDAWYKYTPTEDHELGIWGYGDFASVSYLVQMATGTPPNSLTTWKGLSGIIDKPFQAPVFAGTTYYFRFQPITRTIAPYDLNFSFIKFVNQTVPAGSIFVNDDSTALEVAIAFGRTTDFDNLAFFLIIPPGENGDILPSGIICIDRLSSPGGAVLFTPNLQSVIASLPGAAAGVVAICSNKVDAFYVELTASIISKVSDAGIILNTWDLTGVSGGVHKIAVSPDESILYFSKTGSPAFTQIGRWDLVNDVQLSDLVTTPTAIANSELLCLSDGSIVVILPTSGIIRRYSDAGAVLNDYTIPVGTLNAQDHLAYDNIDYISHFWAWAHDTGGGLDYDIFYRIRVSDGVITNSPKNTDYTNGEYTHNATPTPTSRFGHSHSCPFWISTIEIGPPPTESATLTIGKMSDPDSGLHEFFVDVLTGLTPALLTLTMDDPGHTYDPVPPGIYSVVEQPDDDWHAVYFVSNDVNNNNLAVSVSAGEDVTVLILNTAQTPGGGTYVIVPDSGKPNDDFINGDGSVTIRGLPPPFIITGFIRDA